MGFTEVMIFTLGLQSLMFLWNRQLVVDYGAFELRLRIWYKANNLKYLAHG